jgi:uncharacterized damage-inducible protein DinB
MSQDSYTYGGARALVELHERRLREFLEVWREAEDRQLELPRTSDPNYASRQALLTHVLGAAARYLDWICEQLGIAPPEIDLYPEPDGLAARADEVLEQTLAAWRDPLQDLTEERAYAPAHESRWGPPYCIDAMLEHAVMHPVRHVHQLRKLMEG